MANTKITELIGGTRVIAAGYSRRMSSSNYNTSLKTMATDLASIATQWNNVLVPLVGSLPDGGRALTTRTDTIDPVTNGLDGTQLYLDTLATPLLEDGKWYNTQSARPYTIKESIAAIESRLDSDIDSIRTTVSQIDTQSGLSLYQRQRIGNNIFDTETSSGSDSLDGRTKIILKYIDQLAADIFNTGTDSGAPNSYNWTTTGRQSTDDTILEQIQTNSSSISAILAANYATTTQLNTNVTAIQTAIHNLAGTGAWNTLPTNPFPPGGSVSLQAHVSYTGTGTASATNPHGLALADIDYAAILNPITNDIGDNTAHILSIRNNLIGSGNWVTMSFTDTAIVLANDTIKEAIEALDQALTATTESSPLVNCTSVEAPDGVETSFELAYPVSRDEIPLEGGYPWLAFHMYIFDLSEAPVPSFAPIFSDTTIFITEITGSLPANPGEYTVGYYGATLPVGLDEGEVAIYSPVDTLDPGTVSYYARIPGVYIIQDSIEADINGISQFRFTDFEEDWSGNWATGCTFTVAPLATDTLRFNCRVPTSLVL